MDTARQRALAPVLARAQRKLETAFWHVDDVLVTFSPDEPPGLAEAWSALHRLMTPEFLARRDQVRGLAPADGAPHGRSL